MPFSKELRKFDDTEKRTSFDYVKFTTAYRVVLRMLNPEAREVWKHFIKVANGGKGWGVVCPGRYECPIEQSVAHLTREDEERKAVIARRKFVINVLDRTPYTTCKSCGTATPGKKCISCQADLKQHDFAPLNKVKILEQGPRLFNEVLNNVDRLQREELGKEITEYDLTFSTQGEGRERSIAAIPQPAAPLNEAWLNDPETGEPQALFDLDLLTEPASIAEIEAATRGASAEELLKIRSGQA